MFGSGCRVIVGQDQFAGQRQWRDRVLVDESGKCAENRLVVTSLEFYSLRRGLDEEVANEFRAVP